jgi:hypothetical protein
VAIDLSNLSACIDDVRDAAMDADRGPAEPTDFHALRGRLVPSRAKLPPLYRESVADPYVAKLEDIGESGFVEILISDPGREGAAGLMLDIAHAVLQNGEDFEARATDAIQEVVSDLYDGFLSAEDRRDVKPPDRGAIPPLVKWGNPDFGPYTWPVDATREGFNVAAGVVNLPPGNARRGLLAWSALGHEVGGHDILHADTGLLDELASTILEKLGPVVGAPLARYWADRIDETASDVLGILNMGPATGIGLIGYFRGLFPGGKLRNDGPAGDPHPADIVRGFLAASVVRLLDFQQAAAWADAIDSEVRKDLGTIRLGGAVVTEAKAKQSAALVADVIVNTRVAALEHHALGQIQNWGDDDEDIASELRTVLTSVTQLPPALASGACAAHLVAAGVVAGLTQGANVPRIFRRMIDLLKAMHDSNPSWGPLFITHPGNLARHPAYIRHLDQDGSAMPSRQAAASRSRKRK